MKKYTNRTWSTNKVGEVFNVRWEIDEEAGDSPKQYIAIDYSNENVNALLRPEDCEVVDEDAATE